jgi:hypothetical protein
MMDDAIVPAPGLGAAPFPEPRPGARASSSSRPSPLTPRTWATQLWLPTGGMS